MSTQPCGFDFKICAIKHTHPMQYIIIMSLSSELSKSYLITDVDARGQQPAQRTLCVHKSGLIFTHAEKYTRIYMYINNFIDWHLPRCLRSGTLSLVARK
jgi:hypothetical protein